MNIGSFPARKNGPIPCDLLGDLYVTFKGKKRKIRVFTFSNRDSRSTGLANTVCHYQFYKKNNCLSGDMKQVGINTLYKVLGLPFRRDQTTGKAFTVPIPKKKRVKKKVKKKIKKGGEKK